MTQYKKHATHRTDATNRRNLSHETHSSPEKGFIPPHGGYQKLLSYRKSEVIYDATVKFCDRFIDRKSRTHDQMVQAARSGNKNIAEGSQVSGTSKEAELKLVNVARASLEELLGDYHDYLRQHGHQASDKNSREARYVRKLGQKLDLSYADVQEFVESRSPEVVANILICLIHQADYLLDQQLRRLEHRCFFLPAFEVLSLTCLYALPTDLRCRARLRAAADSLSG